MCQDIHVPMATFEIPLGNQANVAMAADDYQSQVVSTTPLAAGRRNGPVSSGLVQYAPSPIECGQIEEVS